MAQGSSNPTVDLRKIVGTVVDTNSGSASAGTQRVILASNQPVIPVNATQSTSTLSGVQITGIAGQFSCTANSVPLTVGATLTITGTLSGTGTITGYTTGTIYKISATNGSTTFTLVTLADAALTTTAGTPTGLTYTLNIPQSVSNISQFAGKTISMGTGARDTGTQRITIATDDSLQVTQSGTWNIGTVTTVSNVSQLGGQNIAMGTGARSAGTLRVTVATDDVVPASQSGTWNIGTVSTVTNISQLGGQNIAMGTGARSSGTLRVTVATDDVVPASQSGTWNIGTVSTVTNISQLGGVNIAMGTGVRSAGTQRVTIATDDVVPVSDNGGSLTVDNGGTFAVQAAQSGSWSVTATQSTAANLQVTATQAVGSASTRWYAQISDGTNSPAVKAASTSAVAADPSLTVALSPNMPVNSNANSAASGFVNALSIKASAGTLFMLTGYSNKNNAQYIQIFNSASAPSAGAAPTLVFIVPTQSNFTFDFGIYGRYFSTGIYVVNSTTATTYTAGSADCVFDAQYR